MLGCCTYLTAEDTNSKVVDVVAADVEVSVKESIYDSLAVGNSLTLFLKFNTCLARPWGYFAYSLQQSGGKCGVGSQRTCSHFFGS